MIILKVQKEKQKIPTSDLIDVKKNCKIVAKANSIVQIPKTVVVVKKLI
jgi:hypothetical protein